MVADLLLACAAVTLGLTVLDVLLGDARQKTLSFWFTRQWSRLDDLKSRDLFRLQTVLPISLGFACLLGILAIVLDTVLDIFKGFYFMTWLFGWRTTDEIIVGYLSWTLVAGCVLASAALPLVPAVLLWLAQTSVAVLEFVVRRIAEYPKGPVVALSVLVAAIGAMLKGLT